MTGRKDTLIKVTMLCLEWPGSQHSGGVARYAYRMASNLIDQVELTVVTIDGGLDLPGARVVKMRKPTSRFDRYYVLPLLARSVVREQSPDIVHSFGDDWFLSRKLAPLVRSFFGSSWSEAKSSSGIRRLNHAVLALTEKYSQLRSTIRIAIAPESMDAFKCHRLMPPVTKVKYPWKRTPSDLPSVVFVGLFDGRKRGRVAELAVQAVSRRLGRKIDLTIIGPDYDKDFWGPDAHHVSGASDDEVARIISNSWVLLSPSLYEGFGIPVFEALSLGVPAIASANPGSRYIASICGRRGAFGVAGTDSELVELLEERILDGPILGDSDAAAGQDSVHELLELASTTRLVDEVYMPLVRRR